MLVGLAEARTTLRGGQDPRAEDGSAGARDEADWPVDPVFRKMRGNLADPKDKTVDPRMSRWTDSARRLRVVDVGESRDLGAGPASTMEPEARRIASPDRLPFFKARGRAGPLAIPGPMDEGKEFPEMRSLARTSLGSARPRPDRPRDGAEAQYAPSSYVPSGYQAATAPAPAGRQARGRVRPWTGKPRCPPPCRRGPAQASRAGRSAPTARRSRRPSNRRDAAGEGRRLRALRRAGTAPRFAPACAAKYQGGRTTLAMPGKIVGCEHSKNGVCNACQALLEHARPVRRWRGAPAGRVASSGAMPSPRAWPEPLRRTPGPPRLGL